MLDFHHFKDKNKEEWRIKSDSHNDIRQIPSIIEKLRGKTKKKGKLLEIVKENFITETFKAFFSWVKKWFF